MKVGTEKDGFREGRTSPAMPEAIKTKSRKITKYLVST